jgi:hypothetical protein
MAVSASASASAAPVNGAQPAQLHRLTRDEVQNLKEAIPELDRLEVIGAYSGKYTFLLGKTPEKVHSLDFLFEPNDSEMKRIFLGLEIEVNDKLIGEGRVTLLNPRKIRLVYDRLLPQLKLEVREKQEIERAFASSSAPMPDAEKLQIEDALNASAGIARQPPAPNGPSVQPPRPPSPKQPPRPPSPKQPPRPPSPKQPPRPPSPELDDEIDFAQLSIRSRLDLLEETIRCLAVSKRILLKARATIHDLKEYDDQGIKLTDETERLQKELYRNTSFLPPMTAEKVKEMEEVKEELYSLDDTRLAILRSDMSVKDKIAQDLPMIERMGRIRFKIELLKGEVDKPLAPASVADRRRMEDLIDQVIKNRVATYHIENTFYNFKMRPDEYYDKIRPWNREYDQLYYEFDQFRRTLRQEGVDTVDFESRFRIAMYSLPNDLRLIPKGSQYHGFEALKSKIKALVSEKLGLLLVLSGHQHYDVRHWLSIKIKKDYDRRIQALQAELEELQNPKPKLDADEAELQRVLALSLIDK